MAIEKNITMKQFNGTEYDTLYPKTIASQIPDVYSKTDIITTETLSQLGLSADKLPNDAFQQIKTLIDNAQASADGKAKIQTGSYVGTGTYGASNPCSLTFDFVPIFVFIQRTKMETGATFGYYASMVRPSEQAMSIRSLGGDASYDGIMNLTWGNNSLSWYGNISAEESLNESNYTYYWACIGQY